MDYNIRNVDVSLDPKLLQKSKQLANNTTKEAGRSITDQEIKELLTEAQKNDGLVSEEELKFIAGLRTEENVNHLKQSSFSPVQNMISFKNVSENSLNLVRNLAQRMDAGSKATPVERRVKQDEKLRPLFNALNNKSLGFQDRKDLISAYRDQAENKMGALATIAKEDFFTAMTVTSEPGVSNYLYDQAQKEPFKGILHDVSQYLRTHKNTPPQEILREATAIAQRHGQTPPEKYALMSLAALVSGIHKNYPKGPEKDLLINAYGAMNDHPQSVVMGHGVDAISANQGDFSRDNNMHFWAHAFIGYEMRSRGYSPEEARQFSAYVGAVKEVGPPFMGALPSRDIAENDGNAAMKDLLINAYGVEFGVQLFSSSTIPVPSKFEGPQIQDRSVGDPDYTLRYHESY
jgi:hypothetical protein